MGVERMFLAIVVVMGLAVQASFGAVDAYLLLRKGGVQVETDASHGWVKVLGFKNGVGNVVNFDSATGGSAGRVQGKPVSLRIASDQSVGVMMDALATGAVCELTLHVVRPMGGAGGNGVVMTELKYSGVLFSKVITNVADGDDELGVSVDFKYGKLEYVETVLGELGDVDFAVGVGWDFVENSEVSVGDETPDVGSYAGGDDGPTDAEDTDGDGMPDVWEDLYSLDKNSGVDGVLDFDKDGFSNLQEYIAGTDPKRLSSFFKVESGVKPGGVELSWSAIDGRTYEVLAAAKPDAAFLVVHTVVAGGNGILTWSPGAGVGPFFKLRVGE